MELSLEASRYSLGYAAFEAAYAGSYELLFASVYSAPLDGPIALVPRGAATSPVMLGQKSATPDSRRTIRGLYSRF